MNNDELEAAVKDKLRQCLALKIEQALAAHYVAMEINKADNAVSLGYKVAGDFIVFYSSPLGAEWRERYVA